MTTKSPIRNIKSRFLTSNSVNNMSTNGNELKSSRITIKRPLTTANFMANNSPTNGITNQLKKRTLQLNNFFNTKSKSNQTSSSSSEPTNGYQTHESKPIVYHAIAPVSFEDSNYHHHHHPSKQTNGDQQKSDDVPKSPTSRRIANVLANTNIRTMLQDVNGTGKQLSCSEDEEDRSNQNGSLIDADADESDNGSQKIPIKSRRFQKTRKSSSSSLPQKHETTIIPERKNSSSNDEDKTNPTPILNGNSERRIKPLSIKKFDRSTLIPTTTTTDDDTHIRIHRYHPTDNLQKTVLPTTYESSPSQINGSVSNPPTVKKVNRFQVKAIRKSQQQQILLANAAAAKSSNDDDCSVPINKSNSQFHPLIFNRQNANTPTTDGECSSMNTTDKLTNGTHSQTENGHAHVHFLIIPQEKKDSTAEDEKSSNQTTASLSAPAPAPAPPSSAASAQGEDDEEEEAVAKSPDNRFIKYAKEIGRGAFKTVYRGLDTETSVAVAWCELQDFAQFDKQERARFKEEAEMLKKLQHPNIVRFYDFWEETNPRTNKKVIILVTELMTSGSLKGYIRKFKGQNEEKRINVMKKWCRQILKGLAYLHSRNPPVIHRDLKCDNVFISSTTGCVKIGDLGLATFKTQTFAKSMRGTMEFMAPEMFDEQYDELVDIYSFGLCMLEMITGEYPYIECKGPTAVIKRVTAGLKPDCYYKVENEVVKEVIDCCIRTNKEERLPVHELLQHSFFLDDNGLRIDLVRDTSNDSQIMVTNNSIALKLKIVDKTKRKTLWTEHEAIGFRYNFGNDTPEQIVDELITKKYIFDDDRKFVLQSIKDRLRAYHYEEIDRKAGVFSRNGKGTINQSSILIQQSQILPPTPTQLLANPMATNQPQVLSAPPPATTSQPTAADVQQVTKPSNDISQTKPTVQTEPIPISQLSDLSSSVSGSAGSLEILDAALKKTFNKNNLPQSTSTLTNENVDATTLANQDESPIIKLGCDTNVTCDQQTKDESTTNEELASHLFLTTTPIASLQTQSQPTTMVTNYQQQVLQNALLLTPTPQSYSYSAVTPTPHLITTNLSTDSSSVHQLKPSSSSVNSETIENSQTGISPSLINESNQTAITSDNSTAQPQMLGSLKQLDALLKNTFKNPHKTTGTAQNSDTEATTPSIALTINDETSTKSFDFDVDSLKSKSINPFKINTSNVSVQSQPNTSSIILPRTISQAKSQPTSQFSAHFDPLLSPEKSPAELDQSVKSLHDKSLSNDDTITASSSSNNDLSELKTMLMDLNKTFLHRMNVIENKIDEHRNQTLKINNLLTKTILPSLIDLADVIDQTPNLDSRVKTKLQTIQTNLRTSQQQSEMKDLMEI